MPTRTRIEDRAHPAGVLLGCQLGARWCLASSLTCDFNMIKNYTHDWLLLVAAYHASEVKNTKHDDFQRREEEEDV